MVGLWMFHVVINDGGTLDVNSIVYNKSPILILSGTGAAGAGGAIINSNSSSQAKMQGVYLLAGDTTISDNSTGGLDINANSTNFKSFNIKNYTLTLAGSNTAGNDVITTSIIGSGNIIKKGTGTWVLNPGSTSATGYLDYNAGVYSTQSAQAFANTNFFTGSVDIQQGTLKLGQTAALGSSNAAGYSSGVTVQSGATLDLAGKVVAAPVALTLAGTGAAGAGGALINSSSTTANYSGLLTLSDNTTINSSVGSIIISNVGTITGAGKSLTIDGGFNTTINSIIGTGSGGITKNGTGTLTLTGANTLTGNIAVNAGRLQMGSNDALGTSSSPSITVASGATLDLNSNTPTNTNALTISGTGAGSYGGALVNSSVVAASTYSGSITLADDTTISPSSANLILSGKISGNHTLTIGGTAATKYVSLTGASANTMGGINLAGYDLAFTNVNQLGNGTITSSSANAKLVYGPSSSPAATNQSFELSNALNTGADSAKILTISPNDSSNTITLSGAISGSGKLKIGGGGTLVITNTSNSFSGGLEIGTGSISVANDSALGAGTVNFGTATSSALYFTDNNTVSRNFTLGSSSYTANIDVASGKTVQLDGVISPVSTGGKLNKTGNGELILTGVNTYTSSTTITAGTLTLKNSGSAAQASLTVNTGATFKADGTSAVNSKRRFYYIK
jgi:autotransporter-associated beta strand protein